ncbi:unnamed protein product [Rotaria sp. Silwood2]|nr:unnamed protein product [Rotaria sp. Silwood2]CAF4441349.1 unnamed protein product [Rotaria sp. Silwood2]CAF4554405.1 unnamed protein product [Rotaria sp. Silwood2]
MPREARLKCVGCDKSIDSDRKQLAGGGLWRLFMSARSLKRVHNDDPGCLDCRMKYLNWLKKVEEDFDHLKERDVNQDENSDNAMETDVDGGNKSDKGNITEQHVKGDTSEIAIRVPRCTKSHRTCIVCGLSDETCKVLSKQQRTLIFVKRGIFIPEDARCCFHILIADEFDIVVDNVVSMRESCIRSKRAATALFCAKMRLGLSNSVLSTMFHIKDDKVVSRIIHQVTEALMKNFVPKHTGFRHISIDYNFDFVAQKSDDNLIKSYIIRHFFAAYNHLKRL